MWNMEEWMRLWGLDPKTGVPVVWKMWWPWLNHGSQSVSLKVAIGSETPREEKRPVNVTPNQIAAPVVAEPVKPAKKTVRSKKVAAAPAVAEAAPKAAAAETAPAPSKRRAPANKSAGVSASKPTAQKTAAAPSSSAKPVVATPAAQANTTAKAVAPKPVAAVKTDAEPSVPAAAKPLVEQPKVAPVVAAKAPTAQPQPAAAVSVNAMSPAVQRQIEQLGKAPSKEVLRDAIRAVYREKGAATPSQWANWLHQTSDALNTLHLQPMAAAGEIRVLPEEKNTPAAEK